MGQPGGNKQADSALSNRLPPAPELQVIEGRVGVGFQLIEDGKACELKRLDHSAQLITPKTRAIDQAQGFDGKKQAHHQRRDANATAALLMTFGL